MIVSSSALVSLLSFWDGELVWCSIHGSRDSGMWGFRLISIAFLTVQEFVERSCVNMDENYHDLVWFFTEIKSASLVILLISICNSVRELLDLYSLV